MHEVWTGWRAVIGHWDALTTGHTRTRGTTPVAAEISDLVQQTGQLAYASARWTPARAHASQVRDAASLVPSLADLTTALAAVHQAADAISRITATDRQAVIDAATGGRLYTPTRLLPDKYDIPQPYASAPPAHRDALLAAYDTTLAAATRNAAALDDLATAFDAPSSMLAAARRATTTTRSPLGQQTGPEHHLGRAAPGRTEQVLHKLHIGDPVLLLRAAVIDQAAYDLVAEAATKARSRATVAARSRTARVRQGAASARLASQDMPLTPPKPGTEHSSATTQRPLATRRQQLVPGGTSGPCGLSRARQASGPLGR
jgi:hypothetical protein